MLINEEENDQTDKDKFNVINEADLEKWIKIRRGIDAVNKELLKYRNGELKIRLKTATKWHMECKKDTWQMHNLWKPYTKNPGQEKVHWLNFICGWSGSSGPPLPKKREDSQYNVTKFNKTLQLRDTEMPTNNRKLWKWRTDIRIAKKWYKW